jgi:hypothetical protein
MLIAVCKLFGFDGCRPFKSIFDNVTSARRQRKTSILLNAMDTNEIGRIPLKAYTSAFINIQYLSIRIQYCSTP